MNKTRLVGSQCWLLVLVAVARGGEEISNVVQQLKDKNANVRMKAAESLGRMGANARQAVPDLIDCLDDKAAGMRMKAIKALGEIGAKEAVPALSSTAAF